MKHRIFYAAGPGNVIEAHKYWAKGQHYPNEVSITFSVKSKSSAETLLPRRGHRFIPQQSRHLSRWRFHTGTPAQAVGRCASGTAYHLAQILYGLSLLRTAIGFRATVAVLDFLVPATILFFRLFRLAGIKIVTVLHNTLWPSGFPPTCLVPRIIAKLDRSIFAGLPR